MKILYLGNRCSFSIPPLIRLLESGRMPVAIIVPSPPLSEGSRDRVPLPMIRRTMDRHHLDEVAAAAAIEVVEALPDQLAAVVATIRPDLLVSACYPRLVPQKAIDLAPLGGLNIHPSLLPRWRGPDPIFWTFKAFDREAGVTIHVMTDRFDSGPIHVSRSSIIPFGIVGDDLELALADLGGQQLVDLLDEGLAVPVDQAETEAIWAPLPTEADLRIDPQLKLEAAWSLIRGIASQDRPVTLSGNDEMIRITAGLALDRSGNELVAPQANTRWLRFPGGSILVSTVESEVDYLRS